MRVGTFTRACIRLSCVGSLRKRPFSLDSPGRLPAPARYTQRAKSKYLPNQNEMSKLLQAFQNRPANADHRLTFQNGNHPPLFFLMSLKTSRMPRGSYFGTLACASQFRTLPNATPRNPFLSPKLVQ